MRLSEFLLFHIRGELRRRLALVEMGIHEEAESTIYALNGSLIGGRRLAFIEPSPKPYCGRTRSLDDRLVEAPPLRARHKVTFRGR